jgi:uncharacterized protein YjbI with pentapeptide repeats
MLILLGRTYAAENETITFEEHTGIERLLFNSSKGTLEQRDFENLGNPFSIEDVIKPTGPWYLTGYKKPYSGMVYINHSNGSPRIISYMVEGLLEGEYQSWHKNGQLADKSVYENGNIKSTSGVKRWHSNGLIRYISLGANSSYSGVLKSFHEGGNISIQDTYSNGKVIVTSRWLSNGLLRETMEVRPSGKRIKTMWHSTDQMLSQSSHIATGTEEWVLDGEQRRWAKNSQLMKLESYTKGLLDGEQREWAKNGHLMKLESYTQGVLNGLSEDYDNNGQLLSSREYVLGKLISSFPLELIWEDFSEHDFRSINLYRANLEGTDFTESNFSGSDMRFADLRDTDLTGANLRYSDLRGAILINADLTEADLTGAVLIGANLSKAILDNAIFSGAQLSFSKMQNISANETNFKNSVLIAANIEGAEISDSDFSEADMSYAFIKDSKLTSSKFNQSGLRNTKITESDISGSVFDSSDFSRGLIHNTVAEKTNFSGSKFPKTKILGLYTPGGNFTDTQNLTVETVYQGFYYGYPENMLGGPFGLLYKDGGSIWNATGGSQSPGRKNLLPVEGIPDILKGINLRIWNTFVTASQQAAENAAIEMLHELAVLSDSVNRAHDAKTAQLMDTGLTELIDDFVKLEQLEDSDNKVDYGRVIASQNPYSVFIKKGGEEAWPTTEQNPQHDGFMDTDYRYHAIARYKDSVWFYRPSSQGYADVFRLQDYLEYQTEVKRRHQHIIDVYMKTFQKDLVISYAYRYESKAHRKGSLDIRNLDQTPEVRLKDAISISKPLSVSRPHLAILEELYWVEKKAYVRYVPKKVLEANRARAKADMKRKKSERKRVITLTERPSTSTLDVPNEDATIIQINTVVNNGNVNLYKHSDGEMRNFKIQLSPLASATHLHVQPQDLAPLPEDLTRVEFGDLY